MATFVQHRFVIQCDWTNGKRACCDTGQYTSDARMQSLESFIEVAEKNFKDLGWQTTENGTICPGCLDLRRKLRKNKVVEPGSIADQVRSARR